MKFILLAAALVASLALGATSVRADDMASTNSMTTTSTKKMMKTPYKGTITAVDAAGMKVTLKGAKGDMTLLVNSATKFKGGKALSDFAVGDTVTGSYMKDDAGTMTACSIHKKK
jgi:hypothetical protein